MASARQSWSCENIAARCRERIVRVAKELAERAAMELSKESIHIQRLFLNRRAFGEPFLWVVHALSEEFLTPSKLLHMTAGHVAGVGFVADICYNMVHADFTFQKRIGGRDAAAED